MMVTRRQLLRTATSAIFASLVGLPLASFAEAPQTVDRKFLIAGFGIEDAEHGIAIVNLESAGVRRLPLPFMPHSFVRNPSSPHRVWAIERRVYADHRYIPPAGARRPASAAEIDLEKLEIIQRLRLNDTSEFFGHGFFTPDGKTLLISRVDMEKGVGYLTGYDAADCARVVADYRITEGAIHECQLLSDGTALVVGSGVKPVRGPRPFTGPRIKKGSLMQFDLAENRVIREWVIEADDQLAGHSRVMADGTILVVSRARQDVRQPGKVHIGQWDGNRLREIPFTAGIAGGEPGECLTIALNETRNMALITNPQNHRILVVDTKTGTFTGEIGQTVSGLVFDRDANRFIGSGDHLLLLDGCGDEVRSAQGQHYAQVSGPFGSAHSLLL